MRDDHSRRVTAYSAQVVTSMNARLSSRAPEGGIPAAGERRHPMARENPATSGIAIVLSRERGEARRNFVLRRPVQEGQAIGKELGRVYRVGIEADLPPVDADELIRRKGSAHCLVPVVLDLGHYRAMSGAEPVPG